MSKKTKKEKEDKKNKDEPKKMGRPTIYTKELADFICKKIATHSIGLKKLCEMYPELPNKDTINEWRWQHDDFSVQYAKAKMMQAEINAEDCLEISDDARNDWMETFDKDGQPLGWRLNGEHVQRSRLRIDTRKWLAAKLAPKIYGDAANKETQDKSNSLLEQLLLKVSENAK